MSRPYVYRVNVGGNYCGHQPDNPRIGLISPVAKGTGGLPGVLTTLIERIADYYNNPWTIPSLNLANKSSRQQRSERREACLSVMWSILAYTDLTSMRVGYPRHDGFISYTLPLIVKRTGLGKRRANRAIKDLKAAGIITFHHRSEKRADGTYKGIAAIKKVSTEIFDIFGLGTRLKHERNRASHRLERRLKREAKITTRTAIARRKLTAKAALSDASKSISKTFKGAYKNRNRNVNKENQDKQRQQEIEKLVIDLGEQLKRDHPEKPVRECWDLARSILAKRLE